MEFSNFCCAVTCRLSGNAQDALLVQHVVYELNPNISTVVMSFILYNIAIESESNPLVAVRKYGFRAFSAA